MTLLKEETYEVVGQLSATEERDLVEFLGSRMKSKTLLQLVADESQFVGAVYQHWYS